MPTKSIFISHATADKELADQLVSLIELGIGIPDKDVFCTSLEGLGIPSGVNFVDFIKAQLQESQTVLLLLTPHYYASEFCLCELGATWGMTHRTFPLLLPPLTYDDMKGVLLGTQALHLGTQKDLNQFQKEITELLGNHNKDFAIWEKQRDHFLQWIAEYIVNYQPPKKIGPAEHELWAEKQLGEQVDEELQIYHDFIDRITISLYLERWEVICGSLFRQIMPVDFPYGIYQLDFQLFKAILPKKIPEFEDALRNLISRSRVYLDHYLSDAESRPGNPRIMNRQRYKDVHGNHLEEKQLLIEYHLWQRNCTMLLFNLVRALNEFAQIVRTHLRPTFFIRQGHFCVHEMSGSLAENLTLHIPEGYFSEEELAAPLKNDNLNKRDNETDKK